MCRSNTVALVGVVVAIATGSAALCATVDGYVYLDPPPISGCHCLTTVELDGSALHLPQETDCSGYFGPFVMVLPGWHVFTYTHVGYEPVSVLFWVPALGVTLPSVTLTGTALCDAELWKHYPYSLPGSSIVMPYDEGRHDPPSTYPVEWWYVNWHLVAEDGCRYAGVCAFFKPPIVAPGLVLFSVIDLDGGTFYSGARYPLVCSADDSYLNLDFGVPPLTDRWSNRECAGYLLPFEYHISMDWVNDGIGWLELDVAGMKPPLPVSGDGYVEFGGNAWSYYYSHPRVEIIGRLHLPGFPALGKRVQGYGWVDHQWANLPTASITWEWLSIQLADQRDIMVADVWIEGQEQGSFSGGLNYYDAECGLDVLTDYTMVPLRCWYDATHDKVFATAWRVQEPSRQIDLVITAVYEHQVVETTGDIIGAAFWEGACTVSGTIAGQPVYGTAFAEATHSWEAFPGACCMDDGSCRYVPESECAAVGGNWQGLGATCATAECPRPCCFPNNVCQLLLAGDCVGSGGAPQDVGTRCEAAQACCLDGGCEWMSPVCCMSLGGIAASSCEECDLGCCPGSPFGNSGVDYEVPPDPPYLTADRDFHNLIIHSGATLDTRGHVVRVCGTLLNEGTITDSVTGGAGGAGGAGGKGANPKGSPNDPTGCGRTGTNCTSGQPGQPGTGRGGWGGGGGGGGGGAWNDYWLCEADADGGNGGAGGAGGDGGGDVVIYAFRLDNRGVIHADGENGEPGAAAPPGDEGDPEGDGWENCGAEYFHYTCVGFHKDIAGGGGGGGGGGNGGSGGVVTIWYGAVTNLGIIRANGGSGGAGGAGGSYGGYLYHGVDNGGHQSGCAGPANGGNGGRGAHQQGDSSKPGDPGEEGVDGAPGLVQVQSLAFSDCNENGLPDECELHAGQSHDCQPNGQLDECDLAECGPTDPNCADCNQNGFPDACDIASATSEDCDTNHVPDECQGDTDHDGVIDPCDNCPAVYNPGQEDFDSDDVGDVCDNCPGDYNPGQEDSNTNGIGDACEYCLGDLNCDGQVDFADINAFVKYLSNFEGWRALYPDCSPRSGDINLDDEYPSFADINPFVACISSGVPKPCPPGCGP